MFTRRLAPLIVACFVLMPGRPSADDKPYAPFTTDIATVESGGLWEVGKRWGRYRAVVRRGCSPEHCYDNLFVEWVEHGDGRRPKVIATKYIREIPGLTNVSDIRFVFVKKSTRLQVQHVGSDGEDKWTLCFSLGAPAEYSSKEGQCGGAG